MNDPYEFCPDITGDIPLDDRPRLQWRAFWRIFRVLRSDAGRGSIYAPLSVGVAADHVLAEPFRHWWCFFCSRMDDPLKMPIFIRQLHYQATGQLMVAGRRKRR